MSLDQLTRDVDAVVAREASGISDDRTVYHYTDSSAILQIVENNELWLTQREFMNDVFERSYANRILEQAFVKVYGSPGADRFKDFMESMLPKFHKQYVFSLTTENDLISQWAYYGGDDGYSLAFKLSDIVSAFRKKNVVFDSGPVIYQQETQLEILRLLLEYRKAIEEERVGSSSPSQNATTGELDALIVRHHSLFKQSNNYSEREFRILVQESDNISFKVRKGVITPYTKIRWEESLPIREIMIGPSINDEIATEGILQFLESLSSRITVSRSNLRIR